MPHCCLMEVCLAASCDIHFDIRICRIFQQCSKASIFEKPYCKSLLYLLTHVGLCLQVGQTAEALNAARAEVESAEKEAMAVKKKADDLTAAAGRKSAEADNYRDKWEKMKEQVSVAKSAEREHWERAKQVR